MADLPNVQPDSRSDTVMDAPDQIGRPRIEPELSIKSVTTVSRKSVSRSIL